MKDYYLQVRVNREEKEKAEKILALLGTNTSTVVNMLIRQIILSNGIPFPVTMPEKTRDILESGSPSVNTGSEVEEMVPEMEDMGTDISRTSDSDYDDTSDIDAINEQLEKMNKMSTSNVEQRNEKTNDDLMADYSGQFVDLDLFHEDEI